MDGKRSKKEALRQRAEKLLPKKVKTMPRIQDKDIKALVHDLQVHQVELKMQREELRRAQQEIEESRLKYFDLYDFSPVGYFTFSQAGEIVEVNLTGANLLGMERGKLLQRPFSAFVDPQFRSLFRDHRLNVLKSGQGARCELKLVKKDGESFYVFLRSISVPHGKSFRIRSAVGDITELKKAQEKAETEHAFRIAVENSILSGIAAVDPEGRQSYVNIGFCTMVGRGEQELLGKKPPFAYWPPEELEHNTRVFQAAMSGQAPREGIQLRLMRKNGERFDALVVSSLLKDHGGNVIGWIGTFEDITHLKQVEEALRQLNTQLEERVRQRTAEFENANEQLKREISERKEVEQALRESEAKANALIKYAPTGIYEIDYQGPSFISVNDAMCQILGYTRQELLAIGPAALLDDSGRALFANRIRRELAGEKIEESVEYRVRKKDGSFIDAILNVSLNLPGPGKAMVVAYDITDRKRAEKELRESEERYRTLFESMTQGVVYQDAEGKVIAANPAAEMILGLTVAQMEGRTSSDPRWKSIHEDGTDFPGDTHPAMIALRTGKPARNAVMGVFNPQLNRDRWIKIDGVPQFQPGEKKPSQAYTIFDDITERKQAQDELRESEAKFSALYSAMAEGVALHEITYDHSGKAMDYKIIDVNPSYESIIGLRRDAVLGKKASEVYGTGQAPYIDVYARVTSSGIPEYFETHFPPMNKYFSISVFSPSKGKFATVFQDITERKKAEEALKESEERFKLIASSTPDHILIQDAELRYVAVINPQLGLTEKEMVGKTDYEILLREDAEKLTKIKKKVVETGEPEYVNTSLADLKGGMQFFEGAYIPRRNPNGCIDGLIGYFRNVTERARAEEELRRNRDELEDRVRERTAELRESEQRLHQLSAELLNAQEKERRLIAQEIHDGIGASLAATKFKVESALAQISRAHPQTKEFLESVLPIIQETANEARRIQMNLRPSILDDLGILATIGWFCRQYKSTYSAIQVRQEIHIEEQEVSDSLKTVIFRVLQEALNNVAKHSKASEVLLSLRKADQAIQLVVRDNGRGFVVEDILSRKGSSRGLGLDSMRERTELSGGKFTVESTDSGTVIQASWPL